MGATEILTAVLVVITGFYAWQNLRMANEMRAARGVSVLPKLGISLGMVGPQHGFVYVTNVGPGAALDVDIRLVFEPLDNEPHHRMETHWTASVIAAGETQDFMPERRTADQQSGEGDILDIDALIGTYRAIRLIGTYQDALGTKHKVDDVLSDLAHWWHLQTHSGAHWRHPDPDHRFGSTLADRLNQKFSRHNRTVEQELKAIRQALVAIGKRDTQGDSE
jgi:hypothetical protein